MKTNNILKIALCLTSIGLLGACHTVNQITGHEPSQTVAQSTETVGKATKSTKAVKKKEVCKECMKKHGTKKSKKTEKTSKTSTSS